MYLQANVVKLLYMKSEFDHLYIIVEAMYWGRPYAQDSPTKIVLAIIIKPLFSKTRAFIFRLVPIFSLNGNFLKELVLKLLAIIYESVRSSLYLMSDNHTTNRTLHNLLKSDYMCVLHLVNSGIINNNL